MCAGGKGGGVEVWRVPNYQNRLGLIKRPTYMDIKVAPCWVDGKPGLTSMENLSAETSWKPQDIKKGFNKSYPGQVQYLRRYLECIRKLYTLLCLL